MAEPFEILATPFAVYLADEGTERPDLADDPAASGSDWTLLGTRGPDEYDAGGITVTHEQEINLYRGLRGTGPIKAFRTSEGLLIAFTLNDLTLESYGRILNNQEPESEGGARELALHQGPQVSTFALLMKSPDGPYGDGAPIQYWVPKVFQSASPAVVHQKGIPAGLSLVFTALEYLDATEEWERFGLVEAADAPIEP
jgi:hypothetical protein